MSGRNCKRIAGFLVGCPSESRSLVQLARLALSILSTLLLCCGGSSGTCDSANLTWPQSNISSCPYFNINFDVELKCSAVTIDSEAHNLSIEWYSNGCLLGYSSFAGHNDTLVVSSLVPSTNGSYRCQVTDGSEHCLQSHDFTILQKTGSFVEQNSCCDSSMPPPTAQSSSSSSADAASCNCTMWKAVLSVMLTLLGLGVLLALFLHACLPARHRWKQRSKGRKDVGKDHSLEEHRLPKMETDTKGKKYRQQYTGSGCKPMPLPLPQCTRANIDNHPQPEYKSLSRTNMDYEPIYAPRAMFPSSSTHGTPRGTQRKETADILPKLLRKTMQQQAQISDGRSSDDETYEPMAVEAQEAY